VETFFSRLIRQIKTDLEERIENALKDATGIDTIMILRTRQEIQSLIDRNPFGQVKITANTKPYVTFLKDRSGRIRKLPAEGKGFTILGIFDDVVCSVVDLSSTKTPQLMSDLEKEFGKNITTRSWITVMRIASRYNS